MNHRYILSPNRLRLAIVRGDRRAAQSRPNSTRVDRLDAKWEHAARLAVQRRAVFDTMRMRRAEAEMDAYYRRVRPVGYGAYPVATDPHLQTR